MSRRRGAAVPSDAKLFVISNGPYSPVFAPQHPVILLKGSATPSGVHPVTQWIPLAKRLFDEGYNALYLIDFSSLSTELPRELSSKGLGPVLKPISRVLQKLNGKQSVLVAASAVCDLMCKILRQQILADDIAEGVVVEPPAVVNSVRNTPPLPDPVPLHMLQLLPNEATAAKWRELNAGRLTVEEAPAGAAKDKAALADAIGHTVVNQLKALGVQATARPGTMRCYEITYPLNPMTKQPEQQIAEVALEGAPAPPVSHNPTPAPVGLGSAPEEATPEAPTPPEWWAEDRDDFFGVESHMWSLRPGAVVERLAVRVLAVTTPWKKGGWGWATVADSHGAGRVAFTNPTHAKAIAPGAAVLLSGRVLTDPEGICYICPTPVEPRAVVAVAEDELPLLLGNEEGMLQYQAKQMNGGKVKRRYGALLVRGSKVVLHRPRKGADAPMVIPCDAPRDEETPEACAARALSEAINVDPDEFHMAPHLGTLTSFPQAGVVEEVFFAFAVRPPPSGARDDAKEWTEDPSDDYDWFTLHHAIRRCSSHQEVFLDAARRLKGALRAGLVERRWGCGLFGVSSVGEQTAPSAAQETVEAPPAAEEATAVEAAAEPLKEAAVAPLVPAPPRRKLPTTVLSGWLGAGKTTLLQNILTNTAGMRMAVLVNDMSEINVDASIVTPKISRVEEQLVELSNGCICCTLRKDLLEEVARLAEGDRFDYLVIESSGISEPRPVAETFTMDALNGTSLMEVAVLDTMVTVVDGPFFLSEVRSDAQASLQSRGMAAGEGDDRDVGQLLIDQVEFADVLLLNKMDQMQPEQKGRLHRLVRELNETAKVIETQYSNVPLEEVIGTGRFSMEEAAKHKQWLEEEHVPETEEYGISSFVYRRKRPFHPTRLYTTLTEGVGLESVVRSKGYVWLATRMSQVGQWSQAGRCLTVDGGQPWWAAIPKEEWPPTLEDELREGKLWEEPFGDRQQELVVIGIHLKKDIVAKALDACLLTDDELQQGEEAWASLTDKFPSWDEGDETAHSHAPVELQDAPLKGWRISGHHHVPKGKLEVN